MTTLSKNSPRPYGEGKINELPVIAADIIYEGAAVGDNGSGYARPLVAGDPFRGFAIAKADNSAAGSAAGDVSVKLRAQGEVQVSISGLAITDVGNNCYASDDDTFTLTAGSNSHIGIVTRYVSSGVGIVKYNVGDPQTITTDEITDEAVTVGKMADLTRGSILTGQTANNRPAALVAKTSGQILVGDGTDLVSVAVSGDVTLSAAGAVTIAALAVETGMIAEENVTLAKIEDLARGSIITGQTANNRPTALDAKTSGQILVGDGTDLVSVAVSGDVTLSAAGAVTIAAEAVELSMIEDLARGSIITGQTANNRPTALDAKTSGQILVGDGTDLVSVAVSGDVTLSAAGAVTIAALAVETGMIAADAIDGTKLADDAVSLEHLDAGITPSHIVVYAGEFTTLGGDAAEAIGVAGVVATDLVHVTMHTKGAVARTILTASADTNVINVVLSDDPSNDHILTYSVLRAVA